MENLILPVMVIVSIIIGFLAARSYYNKHKEAQGKPIIFVIFVLTVVLAFFGSCGIAVLYNISH
ncbi:MAG: hypothetical protein WCY23_01565 [Candidatus Omnitrophota bacterium]